MRDKNNKGLNWPPERTVKYSLKFEKEESFIVIRIDSDKNIKQNKGR